MKQIISIFLAAIILLSLVACGNSAAKWQEQYDLGMRYLEDGNYEEAIIAFEAAIEIDPNGAAAYLGEAEAYIAMSDWESAMAILEKGYAVAGDESLKMRLEDIQSGTFTDHWGNRIQSFYVDDVLRYYAIITVGEDGLDNGVTSYDPVGNQIDHLNIIWDGHPQPTQDWSEINIDTGYLGKKVREYSENGIRLRVIDYQPEKSHSILEFVQEFSEDGSYVVKDSQYNEDGSLRTIRIYEHDASGNVTKMTIYDGTGEHKSEIVY